MTLKVVHKPGFPTRSKICTFGRVTTVPGYGSAFYWDKGAAALICGIAERVLFVGVDGGFYHPIQPQADIFRSLAPFRRMLKVRCGNVTRGSRSEYVSTFTDSRRRGYASASLSLESEPLSVKDFGSTVFPKTEKTEKASRVIIYRGLRYNVELGSYLKLNEHKIYQGINRIFGHRVVMKGRTLVQRALAVVSSSEGIGPDWVAVMCDISKCDAHTSREAMLFEHSVYKALFPGDRYLDWLLSAQVDLRARTRGGDVSVSVTKRGHRCSGDVNTSLGTVIVVTAIFWLYCKTHLRKFRMMNDGDDTVLFVPRSDLGTLQESIGRFFSDFGFVMRVDGTADVIERVEFCQSRPVRTVHGWTMCRSPRKTLGNDLVSCRIKDVPTALVHMGAIGGCGLSLYSGVPVLQEFYIWCRDHGTVSRATTGPDYRRLGVVRDARAYVPRDRALITDIARVSFFKAWGIPVAAQLAIEGAIREAPSPVQTTSLTLSNKIPSSSSSFTSFFLSTDQWLSPRRNAT